METLSRRPDVAQCAPCPQPAMAKECGHGILAFYRLDEWLAFVSGTLDPDTPCAGPSASG